MEGLIPSKRHQLFFDKKQREGNGARNYSKLYQLANTSFLGEDDLLDRGVIRKLEEIFQLHVGQVGSSSCCQTGLILTEISPLYIVSDDFDKFLCSLR